MRALLVHLSRHLAMAIRVASACPMKPPPDTLTLMSSCFHISSSPRRRGSIILSRASFGSKISTGMLFTRILPFPALTVARAVAVFRFPLNKKAFFDFDMLFTF